MNPILSVGGGEKKTLFKNVYVSSDYKNDIITAGSLEIYRNK